jgi:heme oxygenase
MSRTRGILRDGVRSAHARLDAAVSRFDLADPRDYAAVLRAHARALPPLEASVAPFAWSGWRPRTHLLVADLAALGQPAPAVLAAPALDEAAAWGSQYVLEGSRLGGRVLAGRIRAGAPCAYLSAFLDGEAWRTFQEALETAAEDGGDGWISDALVGARAAFGLFEAAVGREAEACQGA